MQPYAYIGLIFILLAPIKTVAEDKFATSFLIFELEDLKVLRRSPDLLNDVKIGQD